MFKKIKNLGKNEALMKMKEKTITLLTLKNILHQAPLQPNKIISANNISSDEGVRCWSWSQVI